MSTDLFGFDFMPPKTPGGNQYGSEWDSHMLCNIHMTGRIALSGPFLTAFFPNLNWRKSPEEASLAIGIKLVTEEIHIEIPHSTHPKHCIARLIVPPAASEIPVCRGIYTLVWGKERVSEWKVKMAKYIKDVFNITATEAYNRPHAIVDLTKPRNSQGGTHDNDYPVNLP